MTLGQIRHHGGRNLLVYCTSGFWCNQSAVITADWLPDEPRVFDGRITTSGQIERIKEVLNFERIEPCPMRELIEDLWPELLDKLPPKNRTANNRRRPETGGPSQPLLADQDLINRINPSPYRSKMSRMILRVASMSKPPRRHNSGLSVIFWRQS